MKYVVPLIMAMAISVTSGCSSVLTRPNDHLNDLIHRESVQEEPRGIKKQLERAMNDSGECDQVYWADLPGKNILLCDVKEGEGFRHKYGINLDVMCEVRLQENYRGYLFEWLGGDDVIVKSPTEVYSMRFWDKDAANIYGLLDRYLVENNTKERANKCGVSPERKSGYPEEREIKIKGGE